MRTLYMEFFHHITFVNFAFFLGLALVFLCYFLVPLRRRWIVLLLASLAFYLTWGIRRFAFALAATAVCYVGGIVIGRQEDRLRRRLALWAFVLPVLAMLVYAKFFKFLITPEHIIVPLGISYYTFSMIGYMADIYWKKEQAERNFFKFAAFVFYAPKILEGPIEKFRDAGRQITEGHPFDYQRFCFGIQLMVYGYFKKLVIADRIAQVTGKIFAPDAIDPSSGSMLLAGMVLGAFELYCDFSGCMDMARGMSEALGISLSRNFNHPFFARSAAEFWRRWHITLGAWFRDYVLMPMVVSQRMIRLSGFVRKRFGRRAGKSVVQIVPLAAVWIMTGLWHGTGLSYVWWGCYWGGLILAATVFEPELKALCRILRINTEAGSWRVFQMVRTFFIFAAGRLIAQGDAGIVLKKVCSDLRPWELFDGTLLRQGLGGPDLVVLALSLLVLWATGMLQERGSVRVRIAGCNLIFRWALYYLAVFSVLIFGMYGPGFNASDFVYMQF